MKSIILNLNCPGNDNGHLPHKDPVMIVVVPQREDDVTKLEALRDTLIFVDPESICLLEGSKDEVLAATKNIAEILKSFQPEESNSFSEVKELEV